jgi:mono/diheme cytochrome c family protein
MERLLMASLVWLAIPSAMAQPAADPTNGRALAQELCTGCHLVGPEDKGPVPDGIPSFVEIAGRPGTDADRLQIALLRPPHSLMPSPPLDTRETQDVAAYILSLRP